MFLNVLVWVLLFLMIVSLWVDKLNGHALIKSDNSTAPMFNLLILTVVSIGTFWILFKIIKFIKLMKYAVCPLFRLDILILLDLNCMQTAKMLCLGHAKTKKVASIKISHLLETIFVKYSSR